MMMMTWLILPPAWDAAGPVLAVAAGPAGTEVEGAALGAAAGRPDFAAQPAATRASTETPATNLFTNRTLRHPRQGPVKST
jgi:hypothetical protein